MFEEKGCLISRLIFADIFWQSIIFGEFRYFYKRENEREKESEKEREKKRNKRKESALREYVFNFNITNFLIYFDIYLPFFLDLKIVYSILLKGFQNTVLR